LRFSVALFGAIFNEKISVAFESGKEEESDPWEVVQIEILSGILVSVTSV